MRPDYSARARASFAHLFPRSLMIKLTDLKKKKTEWKRFAIGENSSAIRMNFLKISYHSVVDA